MKRIIALAVLALFPSMVSAAERTCAMMGGGADARTGSALKSDLELQVKATASTALEDLAAIHGCLSYAHGYLDAVVEMGAAAGMFALPDSVTGEQVLAIYLQWAKKNPTMTHDPAWNCVFESLKQAFPKK